MLKKCSRCKLEKDTSQFGKHTGRFDGLQTMCNPCKKEYSQKRYQNNKAYFKENNKRHRLKKRQLVVDYLKDKKCQDCPMSNAVCLTFDHVRGKKVAAISDMVNRSFSIEAIKAEIKKCEIRCFNCHMIKDCQKRTTAAATTPQP